MAPKLQPNGKPMRALRVLEAADGWLSEGGVWHSAGRDGTYHDALNQLVQRGLAEWRGPTILAAWRITLAGREYLEDR